MSQSKSNSTPLSSAQAGVDIDAGETLVEKIKPIAGSTKRPGADAELGGFGGAFDLKAAGFQDPILISGTDSQKDYLLLIVIKIFLATTLLSLHLNFLSCINLPDFRPYLSISFCSFE